VDEMLSKTVEICRLILAEFT